MLTSLFVFTGGAVGYHIYESVEKKPATVAEPNHVDVNDATDSDGP